MPLRIEALSTRALLAVLWAAGLAAPVPSLIFRQNGQDLVARRIQ
jgi:hypothetical protein